MRKLHEGSCHCGAVRFRAEIDFEETPTTRCNCSVCAKDRFWKVVIPAADFALLQGGEALPVYTFGRRAIRHRFCPTCGIKAFGEVELDGQPMIAVNVSLIDDLRPTQLAALPLNYEDGRHDAWEREPEVTAYL